MVRSKIARNPSITNYLDDFQFAALSLYICNEMMAQFLSLCDDIGCPISSKKMAWASPVMVFLGTLLDGQQKLIAIPIEKIIKAINLLQWAINKKKSDH